MTPLALREQIVLLPRASAQRRREVLHEGAPGWLRAARNLVRKWQRKVHRAKELDALLTDDELACLDRVEAAAELAPFLPPDAIDKALSLPAGSAEAEDPETIMFSTMVGVLCNWSVSTIRNAASVWARSHIFWDMTNTAAGNRYRGDVIDSLLKSVRASAEHRAKTLHAKRRRTKKTSVGRPMTGGTAVIAFRRGLAFLQRHFGLAFPVQSAILMRSRRRGGHRTRHGESLSLKMVTDIERASWEHPSPTVRAACTATSSMIWGCVRLDQANRSQLVSDVPAHGTFLAYTDREKDPDITRATAKPMWIPVYGVLGPHFSQQLLRLTGLFQKGGFLMPDDNSPDGSPFKASSLKRRPKRKRRALTALREILHHICGVPRRDLKRFGISSCRKLMPNIAVRLFRRDVDRVEVGRWSGSQAKTLEHLIPIDRVAGEFRVRATALPDRYASDAGAIRISGIMTALVDRARQVLEEVGEENLPLFGSWELFGERLDDGASAI